MSEDESCGANAARNSAFEALFGMPRDIDGLDRHAVIVGRKSRGPRVYLFAVMRITKIRVEESRVCIDTSRYTEHLCY